MCNHGCACYRYSRSKCALSYFWLDAACCSDLRVLFCLVPAADPIGVFFDNTYLIGSATTFPEFLGYLLETEPADKKVSACVRA